MDEAYDSPPVFQTGAADGLLCSQDDLYGSRVRVKRERCILPPVLSVYSDASAERPGMLPHVGVFIISVQGLKLEVTQIIGPVVDVQLKSSVPAWRIPTPVRVAQSIRAGHVTVEVQHLLGGGIFRSVAMQGTQGLRRGDPAELLPGRVSGRF